MSRLELRSRISFIEGLIPVLEDIASKGYPEAVQPYIDSYLQELKDLQKALDFLTR